MNDPSSINTLNGIKQNRNTVGLINYFHSLVKQDNKKAIELLNDEALHFGSLFILGAKIYELNLHEKLNERNKTALRIIDEFKTGGRNTPIINEMSLNSIQLIHSALKWALETGHIDDGLNDEYDEILDMAAIFLAKVYRDRAILPLISKMIFERHRKGMYFNDLLWAFLEARDPGSLIFIAKGLKSSDKMDTKLAVRLLNFIPGIDMDSSSLDDRHLFAVKWIEENSPFLHFTGECFHQTSNPVPYEIIWEAKYLCKRVHPETGKMFDELGTFEKSLIDQFNKLDYPNRILLSNYSYGLHHRNLYWWGNWLKYSVSEQIRIAATGGLS